MAKRISVIAQVRRPTTARSGRGESIVFMVSPAT
jgi:hypothetical protein